MDPPSLPQQGANDIDNLIRHMTTNVDIGQPLSAVSIAQDRQPLLTLAAFQSASLI
ncbi:hypothetical protein V8E53_000779 [Lactarius tabidus]